MPQSTGENSHRETGEEFSAAAFQAGAREKKSGRAVGGPAGHGRGLLLWLCLRL